MKTTGSFSVVLRDEPRPGLSILPAWDDDFVREQPVADGKAACASCGHVERSAPARAPRRARCRHAEWRQAVES